jgi:hypothetical protein
MSTVNCRATPPPEQLKIKIFHRNRRHLLQLGVHRLSPENSRESSIF